MMTPLLLLSSFLHRPTDRFLYSYHDEVYLLHIPETTCLLNTTPYTSFSFTLVKRGVFGMAMSIATVGIRGI